MRPLDRIASFFETFAPADLQRLGEIYAEGAFFKDPFNAVHGLPAIRRVYAHMFETLHEPRFVVTRRVADGAEGLLVWEFRFRYRGWRPAVEQVVHGATHLRLAPDGRIQWHRDYWDPAEEVYEKLPLLGGLMRWLKRRAGATSAPGT